MRLRLCRRRGLYFSFDALIALSLLGISTVFLLGTSGVAQSGIDTTGATYRNTNNLAEDATQLSIRSSLSQAFPDGYVHSYISSTDLEEEDKEKSVMNVIAILWAANETDTARNITQEFFNTTIPESHEYRLTISGNTKTVLYNTSDVPPDAEFIANAKRIVSGVQRGRPQEGHIARARATTVDKNTTSVFDIPMSGSAVRPGQSHALKLNRSFKLDAAQIHNATLYMSLHTGGADPNSIDVSVNENDAGFPNTWDYEVDKGSTKLLFHSDEVTSLLKDGWNTVSVDAKNTGSSNDPEQSVHVHPGARMEVTYERSDDANLTNTFTETKYFPNIKTLGSNAADHGVWATMPYFIPDGATVHNVTLHVEARDVDETDKGEEFKLFLNDQKINGSEWCTSSCTAERDISYTFNLTNATEEGMNVVAVYIDTFLDADGSINGFGDDDDIRLVSQPSTSTQNASYLTYSYTHEQGGLVFGKIDLSTTEEFGGTRSNPKTYNTTFNPDASLLRSFVHLAQLDNKNITVQVRDENSPYSPVFRSPRPFANPTDIFIDPNNYNTTVNATNFVNISDTCQVSCDVLPETSFQRKLLIPSQVGYGATFRNRSFAIDDAEERLNETLGSFVEATSIVSSALSVNNLPWLFGPVTVELEVWKP